MISKVLTQTIHFEFQKLSAVNGSNFSCLVGIHAKNISIKNCWHIFLRHNLFRKLERVKKTEIFYSPHEIGLATIVVVLVVVVVVVVVTVIIIATIVVILAVVVVVVVVVIVVGVVVVVVVIVVVVVVVVIVIATMAVGVNKAKT